jgi:hypothetical protein
LSINQPTPNLSCSFLQDYCEAEGVPWFVKGPVRQEQKSPLQNIHTGARVYKLLVSQHIDKRTDINHVLVENMSSLNGQEMDHIELSICRTLSLMMTGKIDHRSIIDVYPMLHRQTILTLQAKELQAI